MAFGQVGLQARPGRARRRAWSGRSRLGDRADLHAADADLYRGEGRRRGRRRTLGRAAPRGLGDGGDRRPMQALRRGRQDRGDGTQRRSWRRRCDDLPGGTERLRAVRYGRCRPESGDDVPRRGRIADRCARVGAARRRRRRRRRRLGRYRRRGRQRTRCREGLGPGRRRIGFGPCSTRRGWCRIGDVRARRHGGGRRRRRRCVRPRQRARGPWLHRRGCRRCGRRRGRLRLRLGIGPADRFEQARAATFDAQRLSARAFHQAMQIRAHERTRSR